MKLEKLEPLDSPNYLRLIFEDGKRLKAPAYKIVELGLTPGAEVTPEVFLALENAQSLASCKERAVRILTASGLSKKELQKRLVQKGESGEDAEAAVAWLEELHLIDDLETAKQLVRSACLRGYGAARAKSILYEKGISLLICSTIKNSSLLLQQYFIFPGHSGRFLKGSCSSIVTAV